MISFQIFDQWQSVAGFATLAFFFLLHPVVNSNSPSLRVVFWGGILLALIAPFTVIVITIEEQDRLVMRSGKIVNILVFVFLFYCYFNKSNLQKNIPNFFWYCYSLAIYSLLELLFVDVLLSGKYGFYKILSKYLNIPNTMILAPINYLIKFIFLGLFFRDSFQNPTSKKVFQYALWALVGFELLQVFVFKSYQGYDSLSSTVKNFFILGGAGLLLYRVYRSPNVSLSLQNNPYFWICLGLILPALSELFLEFIFTKLYQTDPTTFYKLYLVRNASQIIGFTLLIVSVWQAKYLKFLPKEY